jgi:hypothetical protein
MKFEELEIIEVRTTHDVPKPGGSDRNETTQQFRSIDYIFEHCPPGLMIIDKRTKARRWVHLMNLRWAEPAAEKAVAVVKARTG